MTQEHYYTIKEVATRLKVNPMTIWREIRKGKIQASKVGTNYRISKIDLMDYLEGYKLEKNVA